MSDLRRWRLDASGPISPELAADARLSPTDYADDQVWRLSPGTGDGPALALQTRYGGRAGLVSLVPMWTVDGRLIYQAQAHAQPPAITAFAPGYLRAEGKLTPTLTLIAEYRAFESHASGGRFTLVNEGDAATSIRFDLFAHVGIGGHEQPVRLAALDDGVPALSPGRIGNLSPAIMVEDGGPNPDAPGSARLGVTLNVPAGGRVSARWAHGGRPRFADSMALARRWLNRDWDADLETIKKHAAAIPSVETGDERLDATIAWSYHHAAQAFLRPTASLPHASFVATRCSERGFSARGDGSDYTRAWSGQAPTVAYPLALAMAAVNAELAQGIVRNYLAVQRDDGWIDWMPGLMGQQRGLLCLPILARLAWGIWQYTEDDAFLREVFPGLTRFFERWLQADLDLDGDGLPEWQAEAQTGFTAFPTFAVAMPWGQHADIRTVEAPDLAAYLLSEAASLKEIAFYLRDEAAEQTFSGHVERLKRLLESLWNGERYTYRDRDSHATATSVLVLDDGYGDEQHVPALELTPPNRLLVRVTGGLEHVPQMTLYLEGTNAEGHPIQESAASDAFVWTHSRGVYTSRQVYARIDRVWFEGLTRPYRVRVATLDTTRLDINALLPLFSVGLPPERTEAIVKQLTDPAQFYRANGVTMCSAQDPLFDPASERGCGGVWPFWITLLGEGLIESGHLAEAADLLKRLLHAQATVLTETKAFSEFYHSDTPLGLGESRHLGGIAPLHLLLRVIGARVISPTRVWTGGPFAWGEPVTIRHHGAEIYRDTNGTRVQFPSGRRVDLPADASWQVVEDRAVTAETP